MPKERTRRRGAPIKPPGKWSPEATRIFYERYDGNYDLMLEVIEQFDYLIDAKSFTAQIKDFVLGSTYWRSLNTDLFLAQCHCAGCGMSGENNRLSMFENQPYCDKCYVTRKYGN